MRPDPIPPLKRPENWKAIPIVECGEPLVALSPFAPRRIRTASAYCRQGLPGALQEIYIRASAAERLVSAAANLPGQLSLLVWDGWRSTRLQAALFDRYVKELKLDHPNYTRPDLLDEAARFVSVPSMNTLHPSPHLTGGAVDLTVCDAHGNALPMGTDFDSFEERATTRYLEEHPNEADDETTENRRMLFHAMTSAGFTSYSEEWWHFDYGNQFWACITGHSAIYGVATAPQTTLCD